MMKRNLLGCMALAVTLIASCCFAAPPQSITSLTVQNTLSPQEEQRISEYVQYWTQRLHQNESEGYEVVVIAREKLEEPMNAPGLRVTFRNKYSSELVPSLLEIARSEQPYSAINALRVVSALGTKQALDALSDELDNESDDVRLWAAKGIRTMVDEMVATNDMRVRDSDLNRTARSIGRAAENETNWQVLLRQLQALDAIDVMLRKIDSNLVTNEAQDQLLEALDHTISVMIESGDGPSNMMRAVHKSIVELRDKYLHLSSAQKQALGPKLAPVLGRIFEVAKDHWSQVQNDPDSRSMYGNVLAICELLLKFIDREARPDKTVPDTQVKSAWEKGDLDRFTQYQTAWTTVLAAPPYASR